MSTCTTCPYCGVGCGVLAAPDGTISGDPDHPANFGRLCSKGSALGETVGLEDRILHPLIGGAQASWDDALDLVAGRFSDTIREHGPDSVAFYVSGQLLTEDYYVANKLMKGFIGSANIDTNSRLCMASTVAGHKRAFGADLVPGCYEDLEEADLIVLVGSNLAWCHPVLFQRIEAAKQARPSLKIITVDPRRTATSALADLHLAIEPGTDVARVTAPTRLLLTAERTALNLLCHLSGVASITRRWADALDGTSATVRDTRKTTPGLRALEKYAVRCGGGANHRMGLSDMALVKDNHVAAAGGVAAAFARVKDLVSSIPVEIEVDSLDGLREAIEAGADEVLIDNFTPDRMRSAVALRDELDRSVRLEASGGLTLGTAREVADTGVDLIAVGFGEAATAINNAATVVDPSARLFPGHSSNPR